MSKTTGLPEFERAAWREEVLAELNADTEWTQAAKYFSARIEFRGDHSSWAVDTRDGRALSAIAGSHPQGADIVVAAPDEEWRRVLDGETDWFEGTSPGLGQLTVQGDGF